MMTLRPLEVSRIVSKPQLILLRRVAACAADLGSPAYLVGGFVRDALLGLPVNDFDVVVEGNAVALARTLARTWGGRVTVHPAFQTAVWELNDEALDRLRVPKTLRPFSPAFLDLITARSESYAHPGALPAVAPSTIDDDLCRRDFTINAMAIQLDVGGRAGPPRRRGELIDPLGGRADLKAGLVRFLHPRSFVDDPTRMIRAVRYEQRYGFRIEDGTRRAMNSEAKRVLRGLSGERLRHEFDLIFDEPRAAQMIIRLAELDLLKSIHPAVPWEDMVRSRLMRGAPALGSGEVRRSIGWILWLAGLSQSKIEVLAERLAFPAALTREVSSAARLLVDLPSLASARPSQWTTRLDDVPDAAFYAVSLLNLDPAVKQALDDYVSKWKQVKPRTTGHDLQKRGLEPGPRYKEILSRLRAAWLDGEVTSAREERQLLEKLL